jgi:hypothetical protein
MDDFRERVFLAVLPAIVAEALTKPKFSERLAVDKAYSIADYAVIYRAIEDEESLINRISKNCKDIGLKNHRWVNYQCTRCYAKPKTKGEIKAAYQANWRNKQNLIRLAEKTA